MADLIDQLGQKDWFKELRYDEKAKVIDHYNNKAITQLQHKGAGDEFVESYKNYNIKKFNENFAPSKTESFLAGLSDAVTSLPRSALGLNQFLWDIIGTVPGMEQVAASSSEELQKMKESDLLKPRSQHHEYYKWAIEGMASGAGPAYLLRSVGLTEKLAPALKNLPLIETKLASTAKGAFTAGIGEVGVLATMENYVEPKVLGSELDPQTKQVILQAAPFFLGLVSGAGPENIADHMLKNQAFTGEITRLLNTGKTPDEIVKSPELMGELGKKLTPEGEEVSENIDNVQKSVKAANEAQAGAKDGVSPKTGTKVVEGVEFNPEANLVFNANGKPYGTKAAAQMALNKRGLKETHTLYQLDKGQWAFKPKHSGEKFTQVTQQPTVDKETSFEFQQLKDWKEVSPGNFKWQTIDEVIPLKAVQDRLPNAYMFLESKAVGIQRKWQNGYTRNEVMNGLRKAYNEIKPGEPRAERMLNIIDEVEQLGDTVRRDAPRVSGKQVQLDVDEMVQTGKWNEQEGKIVKDFLGRLSKTPDFAIQPGDGFNFYDQVRNLIKIKTPGVFFHETGHWAFYNILSKNDRLGFARKLMTEYNSQNSWNKLIPSRREIMSKATKAYKQGKLDDASYNSIVNHRNSSTELFADMVSQYVWNKQLTAPEFKGMIKKGTEFLKKWFKTIRKSGAEIPEDMQRLVDKVFKSSDPNEQRPIRFENSADELNNHAYFITKQQVQQGIERDPETDLFLDRILNEESDLFKALESSNIDVERVLDGLWAETHKWFHGLDVAYDRKDLKYIYDRLGRFFSPDNREQALQTLKVVGRREMTRGAGRTKKIYNEAVDPLTGGEAQRVTVGERKRMAQEIQRRAESEASAADQMYTAYKQIHNDLYGLFEGLDARKLDELIPAKMQRQHQLRASNQDIYEASIRHEFGPGEAERGVAGRDPRFEEGITNRDPVELMIAKEEGALDWFFEGMTKEQAKSMRNLAFVKSAPAIVSASFGLNFDDEHGVPIPGADINLNWDPVTWATRGWSVGLPFSDLNVPITPGPGLLASAAGFTPRRVGRGVKGVVGKVYDETGEMFPLVRRYVETKRQNVRRIMNSDFVRGFKPSEGLDPEMQKIRKLQRDEEMKIIRDVRAMGKKINETFTRDEQRHIADIIEKGDFEGADGRLVNQAEEVQQLHRQIRESLGEAGYPEEIINKLGDNYLHRIYSRLNKNWRQRPGFGKNISEPEMLNKMWKKIFADYLQPRGLTQKFNSSDATYKDLMTATGNGLKKGDKVYDVGVGDERYFIHESQKDLLRQFEDHEINHQWEVDNVAKGKRGRIDLRRDWTELERQDMGEVKEVVPRMVAYSRMVSRDIALANTFRRLKNTSHVIDPKSLPEETVRQHELDGWVKLSNAETSKGSGVKKYGSLAGQMVSPEAQYLLDAASSYRSSKLFSEDAVGKIYRAWNQLTRAWKIGKTAFNPGTHGRNFIANVHMCVFDGKNPASVLMEGAHHIRNKTELFQEAIDNGMLDSQFLRSEVDLESFIEEMNKANGRFQSELAMSLFEKFTRGASKAARKGIRAPMRAYELGDEIFKMGYIADAVKRGKTAKEGLEEAQESFFDYRDIPRNVQTLRDTGLMPFVTYTYKIIPKLAKVAADNPHRLMGVLLAYELINEMSFNQSYGTERAEEGEAYERRLQPDWMKGEVLGFGPDQSVRIPGQGQEGPIEYYDFMGNIPGGDALSPHGVFGNYPFGFHPVAATIYAMTTERTPQFDKQFSVPVEDIKTGEQMEQAVKERVKFLGQTWLPNVPMYPGSWSLESLGNAVVGEINKKREKAGEEPIEAYGWTGKDYHGTYDNLPEQLVGFAGFGKTRRLYPEQEFMRAVGRLQGEPQRKLQELRRGGRDFRTTKKELQQIQEGAQSLFNRNYQMLLDLEDLRRRAKGE